jgi:hypothetical protein
MDISVTSLSGTSRVAQYDIKPGTCPICHKSIDALPVFGKITNNQSRVQVIFQCPDLGCQSLFIGTYDFSKNVNAYTLTDTQPVRHVDAIFTKEISDISPQFATVYNQAIAAESYGLTELTGIGLRKAIEFLVKDYAKARKQGEQEEIQKATLAACISRYVDDNNVKRCVKRAVWLGNDETHYVRKWEDRDVNDLKVLIKLTVNWIENVLLSDEYEKDMPEK